VCPEWKAQQKIVWAEVLNKTGRGKRQRKIRDRLAEERCGRAVLNSLSTTDAGRRMPAREGAASEMPEAELWEWEEEQEAEELGAGEGLPLFLPTPDFMASAGK